MNITNNCTVYFKIAIVYYIPANGSMDISTRVLLNNKALATHTMKNKCAFISNSHITSYHAVKNKIAIKGNIIINFPMFFNHFSLH